MDIKARRLETFQLPVTIDDSSAESAQIKVWNADDEIQLDETEVFINGALTFNAPVLVVPIGNYKYSITVSYSDGHTDILPDTDNCEECEFPDFVVCSGGPEGES